MKDSSSLIRSAGKIFFLIIIAALLAYCRAEPDIEHSLEASRVPRIRPDYSGTVIPFNIAPLNFAVEEQGRKYFVRIRSVEGKNIDITSKSSSIIIPVRKWRRLLDVNRGNRLFFDIYVLEENGSWKQFRSIMNQIAAEEIDSNIAYRKMKPIYTYWKSIGIYQRNLENYDESVILHGRSFDNGCVNCHTFNNNDPGRMFIGIRSMRYGSATLLAENGKVSKIGANWGYTSWHPSGRNAIYPVMSVRQFFHAAGMEIRDVIDLDSVMLYYDVEEEEVKTDEGFSDKERLETYPTWTPDGRYLYFCSAAIPWTDRTKIPPKNYDKVKYDLRRITYDVATDTWGEQETVLSSEETGLSILEPRISPNGRFLLFCMSKYGCFPIFQPSSDLYMMDLNTGEYRKLEINSQFSESWHSWSSNNRWIVFSSKRRGGLFTRPYISYVAEDGTVYKQFILPQKDPLFYDSYLETFSVPELITGPVTVSSRALARAVRSPDKIVVDTFSGATPKAQKKGVPVRE